MASKTRPNAPKTFTEQWSRALPRRVGALEPLPYASAMRALGEGDMAATVALCKQHPELLTQGSNHGMSLLNASLSRGKAPISIALLAMGAWAGVTPLESTRPVSGAHAEPFEASLDNLWTALARAAPDCLFLDAASAALASSGRAFPSPGEWARLTLRCPKIELSVQIHDAHGLALDPATGTLIDDLILGLDASYGLKRDHPILNAMLGEHNEEASNAWRLIVRFKDALSPDSITKLWNGCILFECPERANSLASLNLFPQGWMLLDAPRGMGPCSALVGAAIFAPAIFKILREIPDAVAAAAAQPHSALLFSKGAAIELASLSRLGIDIGSRDANGHTFLHLWARGDKEPRPGWRTICKARPDFLDLPDNLGRTPRVIQRRNLSTKQRDAFDGTLAAIERSALIKEASPMMDNAPPARRPRI